MSVRPSGARPWVAKRKGEGAGGPAFWDRADPGSAWEWEWESCCSSREARY